MQNNKEDVTRLVGRDAVAGSWALQENADWVCIINPETKSDTGELFLTFKLLKRRYRSSEESDKLRRLDYFNHPFEVGSEIKLVDDIDFPKPVSLTSLATQFEATDDPVKGKQNAIERSSNKKDDKKRNDSSDIFEPFNMNSSKNF